MIDISYMIQVFAIMPVYHITNCILLSYYTPFMMKFNHCFSIWLFIIVTITYLNYLLSRYSLKPPNDSVVSGYVDNVVMQLMDSSIDKDTILERVNLL